MNAHTASQIEPELLDLIPKTDPLPWEDESLHGAMKAAVFAQLKPDTPHQLAVATQIFACLWDQYRHEHLTRALDLASYRKAAVSLLHDEKDIEELLLPDDKNKALVAQLLGEDNAARQAALAHIAAKGITEADILAKAYLDHFQEAEALARRPTRLDERRRALMEEYGMLKTQLVRDAVPDAELIEAPGDD
ncbi:hypothetical protein [Ovoidimarina sediminis]|uniref:hypothetical protein n=1 Tax=Ovoidimarina sediminis TaxID=3079856 RepID=UPI002910DB77|nr:hypothetical protein [Rhodophyticola sp. MJ-SS7]MDU8945520.1 hypothetical protein [Rhodophyticola sp. MJ-SS7]